MNIWLFQVGEPYPFMEEVQMMRTGLLAQHLANRGHNVLWWGSTFYHPRKELLFKSEADISIQSNLCIRLLEGITYKHNLSFRRYAHHKKLAKRFSSLAEHQSPPDLVLASLPLHDFAYEAVKYANLNCIPAIVDVRDLWPDFFLKLLPKHLTALGKLIFANDFYRTSYALKNCDVIYSISNSYLNWALGYAKRDLDPNKDKVYPIGSPPLIGAERNASKTEKISNILSLENKIVFGFIGTFGKTYDLNILLQAAEYLFKNKIDNIYFLVAGDGDSFLDISRLAKNFGNIKLTGWLNKSDIVEFMQTIDVGIVPYTKRAPQSLPNKPFQYLAAGIPIISSLQGELSDILVNNEIGLTYESENLDSFLAALQKLASDSILRTMMGTNALVSFNTLYNSDIIYDRMVSHLERIVLG
jgi:glycosyltransferase involved in cell wall biosynthesis